MIEFLVCGDGHDGEFAVQCQHLLHQRYHLVVADDIRRVGKVDGADGKLIEELGEVAEGKAQKRRFSQLTKVMASGSLWFKMCAVMACPIGMPGFSCQASQVWINALGWCIGL